MRNTLAALVAIGLLLLVGCGRAESGPRLITEAKDILGTYEAVDSDGYFISYVEFREDGTLRAAPQIESLEDRGGTNIAWLTEEFWFDDGLLHRRIIDSYFSFRELCNTAIGVYEVHLLEDGSFTTTLVEDECQGRPVAQFKGRYVPLE